MVASSLRLPTLRAALAAVVTALATLPALASDIGVSPVAVNLDKANDRATVNVVNNGKEAVVMQAEVIEWKRTSDRQDQDGPTTDMIVNPAVFTLPAGATQVVRVGLRKAAQEAHEGTYRIVLREVPTPPQPGETRISGQVRVLMALRVPIYVAPNKVVRDPRWQATREADGTIVATVQNEGNVHVRVGRLRVRAADAEPNALPVSEQAVAAVVFPGEGHQFRFAKIADKPGSRLMIEIATDQGAHEVPVTLARK